MTATRINDHEIYEEHDDLLGFDWGAIIQPAVGVGVPAVLSMFGGGGGQGGQANPCRQHPVECLDQLITQYNADMNNARAGGATPQQLIEIVTQYLAVLNDGNTFTQSGEYLSNTKSQMQAKITELRAMPVAAPAAAAAGTPPTQVVVTDPATGQQTLVTVPAATGQIISGVSNTTLLLGAALVGFVLFTRK